MIRLFRGDYETLVRRLGKRKVAVMVRNIIHRLVEETSVEVQNDRPVNLPAVGTGEPSE